MGETVIWEKPSFYKRFRRIRKEWDINPPAINMRALFYVMNCIGWIYCLTCIYRVFQLRYRRFDRYACRFERYGHFEDIPQEYFHREASMIEYKGEIFPMDSVYDETVEKHGGDYFFMIPDAYKVLRSVRIKEIDVDSVNDPQSRKYKYVTVKKYKKIDAGLWILSQWGDAVPTYEIYWKDIYGRHKYYYGKAEDYIINHGFFNALLYVLGLSQA